MLRVRVQPDTVFAAALCRGFAFFPFALPLRRRRLGSTDGGERELQSARQQQPDPGAPTLSGGDEDLGKPVEPLAIHRGSLPASAPANASVIAGVVFGNLAATITEVKTEGC
jgi:hypothetical protein